MTKFQRLAVVVSVLIFITSWIYVANGRVQSARANYDSELQLCMVMDISAEAFRDCTNVAGERYEKALKPNWAAELLFAAVIDALFCLGILLSWATYRWVIAGKRRDSQPHNQVENDYSESSDSQDALNAVKGVLDEANLYAYELANGLVPDGNSEKTPGYGPMDFDEWRAWKQEAVKNTRNISNS